MGSGACGAGSTSGGFAMFSSIFRSVAHYFSARHVRDYCDCVIFHKPCMAFTTPRRLAIEIALYKRTDLCFRLGQGFNIGPRIQLPLCEPADNLVLPKRQTFGIALIHCGNMDVASRLRIEHVDVAEIAGIERQFDFRSHSDSTTQFAEFRAIVFQPLSSMP